MQVDGTSLSRNWFVLWQLSVHCSSSVAREVTPAMIPSSCAETSVSPRVHGSSMKRKASSTTNMKILRNTDETHLLLGAVQFRALAVEFRLKLFKAVIRIRKQPVGLFRLECSLYEWRRSRCSARGCFWVSLVLNAKCC